MSRIPIKMPATFTMKVAGIYFYDKLSLLFDGYKNRYEIGP